jgi:hypothetical protein
MSYLSLPTFTQALLEGKNATSRAWYFFFQGLWKGQPPGAQSPVTVTTSPFTFPATQRGYLIVQGGTVSMIQTNRDGVTNMNTGQTQGCIPVSAGDLAIVTYSVKPNLTFVPQ